MKPNPDVELIGESTHVGYEAGHLGLYLRTTDAQVARVKIRLHEGAAAHLAGQLQYPDTGPAADANLPEEERAHWKAIAEERAELMKNLRYAQTDVRRAITSRAELTDVLFDEDHHGQLGEVIDQLLARARHALIAAVALAQQIDAPTHTCLAAAVTDIEPSVTDQ